MLPRVTQTEEILTLAHWVPREASLSQSRHFTPLWERIVTLSGERRVSKNGDSREGVRVSLLFQVISKSYSASNILGCNQEYVQFDAEYDFFNHEIKQRTQDSWLLLGVWRAV